mgnify:CR=1 FL=1
MIIGFFLASNGADAIILASNNLYGFPNSDYLKRRIKAIFIIILIALATGGFWWYTFFTNIKFVNFF